MPSMDSEAKPVSWVAASELSEGKWGGCRWVRCKTRWPDVSPQPVPKSVRVWSFSPSKTGRLASKLGVWMRFIVPFLHFFVVKSPSKNLVLVYCRGSQFFIRGVRPCVTGRVRLPGFLPLFVSLSLSPFICSQKAPSTRNLLFLKLFGAYGDVFWGFVFGRLIFHQASSLCPVSNSHCFSLIFDLFDHG